MPYKDKEKQKECIRLWREKNKEKIREQNRLYRETNKEEKKEKQKEYQKEWYEKNKEKIREQKKEYSKIYKHTDTAIKSRVINNWKRRGVINDDFNSLYEYYLNCKFCEECEVELTIGYKSANRRCLDHDHKTGLFRNVLCNNCNVRRGIIDRGTIKLTPAEIAWKYRLKKFILY